MSPHEQFGSVMARIGVLPSVIRVRRDDAARAERQVADFESRVEAAVVKLEKVAAELEKALA